jgi:hypothetical protein
MLSNWATDLSKALTETHVVDNFLQVYSPASSSWPAKDHTVQWRSVVIAMSTDNSLVRKTVAALGLSCLGQQADDARMVHHGTKLYSAALAQLNEALQHTRGTRTDANILAAIQLMVCLLWSFLYYVPSFGGRFDLSFIILEYC